MTPNPVSSARRYSADYRRRRAFSSGAQIADPVSKLNCVRAAAATAYNSNGVALDFASNVARVTDRGLITEARSRQLLTNSTFSGAVPGPAGSAPTVWRLNGAGVSNVVAGTYNGLPAIALDVTVVNATSSAVTYRLDLESAAGIAIPAERKAIFHGMATIVSSTNSSAHEARLIPRLAGGAATADQGRTALAVGATPVRFRSAPVIESGAVILGPAITWGVAASSTSVTRLMLVAVQAEPGLTISSFIPSFPPTETREQLHPNPTFAGAVAGTPGTLPQYVSPGTVTSYQVLAVGDGWFDVELVGTAGASDAIISFPLNTLPPGGPNGLIAAAPGQTVEASIEAQVLADNGGNPRLNFTARTAAGQTITGFNTSGNFTSTTALLRVSRRFESLPAGTTNLAMQVLMTVPAGTTCTTRLRLRAPHCDRITVTPGSASPDRPLDVVSFLEPSVLSGASEVVVEAELDSLVENATLMSVMFAGGYKLRLVAGPQVGAIVTMPDGQDISAFSPLYAAPGVIRLALSYQAGLVAIGFSDACEGRSAQIVAPGFDPTVAINAWLGSDNGQDGLTTAVRLIDVHEGFTPVQHLAQRTRERWFPRTFIQPVSGMRAPDIESVAPYSPPGVTITGASYNYVPSGNRYVRRSNGGAEMVDYFPLPSEVQVSEGAPFRINIVNDDVVPLRIRVLPGSTSKIYPPGFTLPYTLAPIPELVIPPGRRVLACLDGYNPATEVWEPTYNWWYVERGITELLVTYEFLSIYGPPSPLNPSRNIIFPPAFCSYNADIGVPRAVSAGATQAMNRGIYYASPLEFTKSIRYQRDAALRDYWRFSVGPTTITQLKTQIVSMGFAYLGSRDAGVGTAEDHRVIREWFRDRMDQTIAFFDSAYDSGAGTGRGNHATAAGLAAAVCAQILDRADYLQWAIKIFVRAMQEAALEEVAPITGPTGAFLLEMKRADKSLQYQFLNMTYMLPLAEMLERAGFPAYSIFDGILIKCINFSMAALQNPQLVTDEQNRLIALGSPWGDGVFAVEQLPIGFSNDVDPVTGEPLFNESRIAAFYLAYRRLTTAQAPWRPSMQGPFIAYNNIYNGSIGGSQSYLYRFPGITLPEPPPET